MTTQTLEQQIKAASDNYVAHITAIARQAAITNLTSLASALDTQEDDASTFSGATVKMAGDDSKSAKKNGKPAKGEKRSPEDLEALTDSLLAEIENNPGQGISQIKLAIGVDAKDLILPARKLLTAKLISTKGQKRSTTYWPKK